MSILQKHSQMLLQMYGPITLIITAMKAKSDSKKAFKKYVFCAL